MKFLPAIDIMNGKVVRLFKGRFEEKTVYSGDPVAVAREFKKKGADFLHIVDLSGAKAEKAQQYNLLKSIVDIGCDIEVGGGVRSIVDVKKLLDIGVKRVIIGTRAVSDPGFVSQAVDEFGAEAVVVALDIDGGYVRIKGWRENSNTTLDDMLSVFSPLKVAVLITDISRDGTLEGIDADFYKGIADKYAGGIIISGGVSSLKDIRAAAGLAQERQNIDGIVAGKAIYEGRISIEEAIKICSQSV